MLVILVMFVPIATYAQTDFNTIILEPAPDSTDVVVTIEGELDDGGVVILYIEGFFGSNSVGGYSQEHTLTENNPTHVFNLDYQFQPSEIYTLTAMNGHTHKKLQWVPLPITQEETPSKQDTSENSNIVEEQQLALALEEPTSEQTILDDSVQSLQEENKLLREEIEKKNAVIMEQIKVIQDLASQFTNANFEHTLNYFSLV